MKRTALLVVFSFIATGLRAGAPDSPVTVSSNPAFSAPAKNPKSPEGVIPEAPNPWRVTAGAQWRQIGRLHFNGSTNADGFTLPNPIAEHPLHVGDPGVIGNRIYKDGFNKIDVTNSATTFNWGYDHAGQITPVIGAAKVDLLSLHATGTQVSSRQNVRAFDPNWDDDQSGAGAFIKLESPALWRSGDVSFSAEFGYSYTHGSSGNGVDAVRMDQHSDIHSSNVTDVYVVPGGAPPAPYAGTFNGPGPRISNLPISRSVSTSDRVLLSMYTSTLSSQVTTNLHTFSFGADVHEELGRLRLGLSGGLALNVTNWESSTQENLRNNRTGGLIQAWDFRQSGTHLNPGFYLEASASVPITERLSFFTSGRYDWSGSLHGHVAGSTFDLALGGWTAAAGLTLKF